MRVGFWDAWLQLRRANPDRDGVPACLALAGAVAGVRWNHLPPQGAHADILPPGEGDPGLVEPAMNLLRGAALAAAFAGGASPSAASQQGKRRPKWNAEAGEARGRPRSSARHDTFGTQVQALDKAKALEADVNNEGGGIRRHGTPKKTPSNGDADARAHGLPLRRAADDPRHGARVRPRGAGALTPASGKRKAGFPTAVVAKLGELEPARHVVVPEEWGGSFSDYVAYALAMEEIAAGCASTATLMSVHNSVGCGPHPRVGKRSAEEGDSSPTWRRAARSGCFCLTEPQAGSEANNLRTHAPC